MPADKAEIVVAKAGSTRTFEPKARIENTRATSSK